MQSGFIEISRNISHGSSKLKLFMTYVHSNLSFKAHASTYNLDYEKQSATFIPKHIHEYHPTEQTSEYNPEKLPSEQVKSCFFLVTFIYYHIFH